MRWSEMKIVKHMMLFAGAFISFWAACGYVRLALSSKASEGYGPPKAIREDHWTVLTLAWAICSLGTACLGLVFMYYGLSCLNSHLVDKLRRLIRGNERNGHK